jgi:hypothetical protein
MPLLLHINCSEGLTVHSLAKAILSIDAPKGLSLELIEEMILQTFPRIVREIKLLSCEPFFHIRFEESAVLDDVLSTIDQSTNLQETSVRKGRAYVQKLIEMTAEYDAVSPLKRVEVAILAMCILWWLERFDVQNISLSPIPVLSTIMKNCPSLWEQLPVIVTSPVPLVSNNALPLLKILLDVDKRDAVDYSPLPMILTQHCHGEYHSPFSHATSVSVGTPMTTTPPLSSTPLWQTNKLLMLEANIDDCTAEYLAFCVDMLLTRGGAADAWITPIVMKKGRAAHTIHCLCKESNQNTCLELLFRHSTTLGIRVTGLDRVSLNRTLVTVTSKTWSSDEAKAMRVDVKVGYLGGEVVSMKAEFDHCVRIAKSLDVPVRAIADEAVQLAKQQLEDGKQPCQQKIIY